MPKCQPARATMSTIHWYPVMPAYHGRCCPPSSGKGAVLVMPSAWCTLEPHFRPRVDRLLRLEAHRHRPLAVRARGGERRPLGDRPDQQVHLLAQLEHLTGDLRDRHVAQRLTALVLEPERRL